MNTDRTFFDAHRDELATLVDAALAKATEGTWEHYGLLLLQIALAPGGDAWALWQGATAVAARTPPAIEGQKPSLRPRALAWCAMAMGAALAGDAARYTVAIGEARGWVNPVAPRYTKASDAFRNLGTRREARSTDDEDDED